jgi:hypothetical protein
VFLFSEKTGFKAYCDKTCHDVKFPEFLNKDKKSHLPQVANALFTILSSPASKAWMLPPEAGGDIFASY